MNVHLCSIISIENILKCHFISSRELNGCIAAATGTHCENLYLLTYNETRGAVVKNGYKVKIMPVWEWLLTENSDDE